ncbi:hypothetical protein [Salibacterium halotolerans]|uniref:Uncharacterized protein n=1 Tax=Salibacterium halotolerans TaxID=1884432 RepID=A0A1I5MLJ9_9BACI|nr:hypothetical protein [Salibacterium halotolerans]SFP10419.1 hypothetical protein SAMN05518683_102275 [Salibacterium halotolerans]
MMVQLDLIESLHYFNPAASAWIDTKQEPVHCYVKAVVPEKRNSRKSDFMTWAAHRDAIFRAYECSLSEAEEILHHSYENNTPVTMKIYRDEEHEFYFTKVEDYLK